MAKKTKLKAPVTALKGGLGGITELIDQRTPGKDLRLIKSAINHGWLIPEQAMSDLPAAMLGMAMDTGTDARARVSAAKVLCTMYGQANHSNGTTLNVGVMVNNGADLLD